MQPGAVRQAYVDVRGRVVEPASCLRRQALGQTAYGVVVGEPHGHRLEPGAAVDEDLCRAVDEHVGDAVLAQQRLERSGPDDVVAERLVDGQHGRVADRAAGLAQRLGDPVRGQLTGGERQSFADRLDQGRGDRGRHVRHLRGHLRQHLGGGPGQRSAP